MVVVAIRRRCAVYIMITQCGYILGKQLLFTLIVWRASKGLALTAIWSWSYEQRTSTVLLQLQDPGWDPIERPSRDGRCQTRKGVVRSGTNFGELLTRVTIEVIVELY